MSYSVALSKCRFVPWRRFCDGLTCDQSMGGDKPHADIAILNEGTGLGGSSYSIGSKRGTLSK